MKIDELTFLYFDDEGYKHYRCPLCGGEVKVHESVFYGRCDTCLATILDYVPAPHQVDFHSSKAKFRLNIGGFGSGKTTMDACEKILSRVVPKENIIRLAIGRTI